MKQNKVKGIIAMILSVLGGFYSITTYAEDTSGLYRYSYAPPFTTHEIVVIVIGILSVIALIIGLYWLKSSRETESDN